MSFTALPENPLRALEALAIYRYLTAKQLVALDIAASPTVARDHVVRHLKRGRSPLIKTHDFGRWPAYGRLPHIHYLTAKGASCLCEYKGLPANSVRYPKGGVQFTRDIFHRMALIDSHIALRKWAQGNEFSIDFSYQYFDKTGSLQGQICDTRLDLDGGDFIEPDGLFCLSKDKFKLPISLEVHRYPDTGRIAEQLQKNAFAIHSQSMASKYGLGVNNIVLSVHEQANTMKAVQKRVLEAPGFDAYLPGFLFNTLAQVKEDFTKGWTFADTTPAPHFEV
jgi:hypothetical protein